MKLKIIIPIVFAFLTALYIIWQQKIYYTGDMVINTFMASDFLHGHLASWYFYGQNYFGNLQVPFNAFAQLLFGDSPFVMIVSEYF